MYRTQTALLGYRDPRVDSDPIRIIQRNRRIEGNDRNMAITVVAASAYGRARQAMQFQAESYGATNYIDRDTPSRTVNAQLQAGEAIEVLDIVCVEGNCRAYFRRNGMVYSTYLGDGSQDINRYFEMAGMPRTEVWLHLTARDGKPAAWVMVSGAGADVIDCDWRR